MVRPIRSCVLFVTLILCLLFPIPGSPPVAGSRAAVIDLAETLDKVEPALLQGLALGGEADFIVWLPEKADLAPAYGIASKEERGRLVLQALRETAERSQSALRQQLDAQGIDYRPFYIANKVLVRGGTQAVLLSIAARPDVGRVTANHRLQLDEPRVASAPIAAQGTGVEPNIAFIRADQVWSAGVDGTGTVLAANDTGFEGTHPAIAPHYRGCLNPPDCTVADHNYNWWDATGVYPAAPQDGHGHGTHVTGIMVGDDGGENQIGVAPGAQTIHCRNMNDAGTGYDATVIECFEWDLAPWDLNGANPRPDLAPDVVNNSWGYAGGAQGQFRDEIQALHAAGILVEVSAGNQGSACSTLNSPGDYVEVLTTGSVSHAQPFPGALSGLSSRGPSGLDPAPPNYFPDVVAPGEHIRSSVPGQRYASLSGTSMAGPHATALAGLIWSACPSLRGDVDATFDLIHRTTAPLVGQTGSNCGGDYVTGPNNDWGYGTIDALASVQLAQALCAGLGQLSGTIREGGKPSHPVEGVTVSAAWEGGYEWGDVTDASGFYSMTLPSGAYALRLALFGYLTQEIVGVQVAEGAMTVQDVALARAPEHRVVGRVTEAGTGRPLSATLQVLYTPLPPVWTDPATGAYAIALPEGAYTFDVTAARHRPEQRQVTVDRDMTQDYALLPGPCILLVDDDNDLPDVRPYYGAALEALGYSYDVFDVGGGSGNGPALAALQQHAIAIWFSGDKYVRAAGPNAIDEANLAAYLDGGGRLFLSSQDYLWDAGLTPFGMTYLGVASYWNDKGDAIAVQGVAGDPVGEGLGPYALAYPEGFADYGDIVEPTAGASTAYRSANAAAYSLNLDAQGGDWRTVFFGTSWVPIYAGDAASGIAVLQRIVEWFGGCDSLPPTVAIADPLEGQVVRGVYRVRVSAEDESGIAAVALRIDEGEWIDLTPNWDGTHYWYDWPTTAYPDGSHTLRARAVDAAAQSAESDLRGVSVDNAPAPGAMHVGDLDAAPVRANSKFWWASVAVTVHDADHGPLPDVRVRGAWSSDPAHPRSCTTDAAGQCIVTSPKADLAAQEVRFVVDALTHAAHAYDPGANHDPDGDSDGTAITIYPHAPPNQPPVAAFAYDCVGLSCSLDGSASYDPDGAVAGYAWDLGDGTSGEGVVVQHTYAVPATYAVTLTVADAQGATGDHTEALLVEDETYRAYLPLLSR
ncbi:MAG: S8 family serine peptidase [Anaerolineae bacterium]|nr:S8 family serine peptidase [Anaerolineae bacterium]